MKSPETQLAALSLLAVMPKSDKPAEKNQDSAHYDIAGGRFAVADGVSRMLFSEWFSRSLTARFCDAGDAASASLFETKDWQTWLLPSCNAWREATPAQIAAAKGLAQTTLTNRWNAGHHGGATFAGIEIKAGNAREPMRWQAVVIGDCCLIHLDAKGNWLASYVMKSSAEFDSRPDMFVSGAEEGLPAPAFLHGTAARNDSFILASDTMAKWLMQQHEAGNWPLAYAWLMAMDDAQAFAEHIDHLRSDPPVVMDDDDITLMLVKVAPAKPIAPRILMPATTPSHDEVEIVDEAVAIPEGDEPVDDPLPEWAARLKASAMAFWMAARPHLTRRRVLPAIAIALVLVAVLLGIRALDQYKFGRTASPLPTPAATHAPYIAREILHIPVSTERKP